MRVAIARKPQHQRQAKSLVGRFRRHDPGDLLRQPVVDPLVGVQVDAPAPKALFKRELLYVPFFGWALGLLKMVHIDRKEGKYAFASVVKQGRKRMSEGAWVIMFPEGTRTQVGSQGKYKTGGARFAIDAGAPVVPIAHNAGHVWPRNSFIKYAGTVTVSIGKPIASAGLTPDELNSRVEAWIETEMRRIDPDAYRDTDIGGAGLRVGKRPNAVRS